MSARDIGLEVRRCRVLNNWTFRELADAVGCTRSHLCDIEHGHRNLTLDMAKAIEKALESDGELVPLVECPCCGRRIAGEPTKSANDAATSVLKQIRQTMSVAVESAESIDAIRDEDWHEEQGVFSVDDCKSMLALIDSTRDRADREAR